MKKINSFIKKYTALSILLFFTITIDCLWGLCLYWGQYESTSNVGTFAMFILLFPIALALTIATIVLAIIAIVKKKKKSPFLNRHPAFLVLLILSILINILYTIPVIIGEANCKFELESCEPFDPFFFVFLLVPLALSIATLIVGLIGFLNDKDKQEPKNK